MLVEPLRPRPQHQKRQGISSEAAPTLIGMVDPMPAADLTRPQQKEDLGEGITLSAIGAAHLQNTAESLAIPTPFRMGLQIKGRNDLGHAVAGGIPLGEVVLLRHANSQSAIPSPCLSQRHEDVIDRSTMQRLFNAARAEAQRGWIEGGIPIGAVLAQEDGTIVAQGQNQRVENGDPTSHGETQCIRNAGRRQDWRELTLVTTLSPCPMCAGTAVLLGFRRVVIGELTTFQGAEAWLKKAGIEVNCLDDPCCEQLMRTMQEQKPELWAEDIGC